MFPSPKIIVFINLVFYPNQNRLTSILVYFQNNKTQFNQLELKRQRRQHDLDCAKIFQLISNHWKEDPAADKTEDIKGLVSKVNLSCKDGDGDTFLHAAIQEGHIDIISLLLRTPNIDVNIENRDKKHPQIQQGIYITTMLIFKASSLN